MEGREVCLTAILVEVYMKTFTHTHTYVCLCLCKSNLKKFIALRQKLQIAAIHTHTRTYSCIESERHQHSVWGRVARAHRGTHTHTYRQSYRWRHPHIPLARCMQTLSDFFAVATKCCSSPLPLQLQQKHKIQQTLTQNLFCNHKQN